MFVCTRCLVRCTSDTLRVTLCLGRVFGLQCKCIDPKNQGKPTCGSPSYKGDGVCDDNNNNKGCDYDGGDCCGAQVNKKYCKVVGFDGRL